MLKIKPKFKAINMNGELVFVDPDAVKKYLWSMPQEVYVNITKKTKSRSLNQNSYYWAIVLPLIADNLGYYIDEMHEICRNKFLMTNKKGLSFARSTSDLTTTEFENYLSNIREWASIEFSIYIPLPNEENFDERFI